MMWHSLDENGKIEIYDVQWSNGTVETNIPVGLLESVREGTHTEGEEHGVQEKYTPVNERQYKGQKMKVSKSRLKEIIKEELAYLSEAMPAGGVPDVVGVVTGMRGETRRQAMENVAAEITEDQEYTRGYLAALEGIASDVGTSPWPGAYDRGYEEGLADFAFDEDLTR